jgi:hypothetical protein
MIQQTFLQRLETLGYYPLPRLHADSPGYGGLLVVLRQAPRQHEPEKLEICLREGNDHTPTVHLKADAPQPFSRVVCPGRIIIRSREGREATFYSFGGTLESESLPSELVFSLRSAAPVLELQPEQETVADLLADATEGLFARAEAQLQLSSSQLRQQLAVAGPEAVYLAVLQSLWTERVETAVSHRPHLTATLSSERNWYQQSGRWPFLSQGLTTLLHPETL